MLWPFVLFIAGFAHGEHGEDLDFEANKMDA